MNEEFTRPRKQKEICRIIDYKISRFYTTIELTAILKTNHLVRVTKGFVKLQGSISPHHFKG